MRSRLIVLCLVAALVVPAVPAEAKKVRTSRVGGGVTLKQIKRNKPKLRIKVVRIKKTRINDLKAVLGTGKLPGWERTSSIARRHRAVVAINGDYGRSSGRPVMAFANSWRLRQSPLEWGRNFAVSHGRQTFIGHPKVGIWLTAAGQKLPVRRLNNGGPYGNQLAMFDRTGSYLERPPKRACSARLKASGMPRSNPHGGLVTRHTVAKVSCKRGRMWPKSGRVVSAPWRSKKAEVIRSLGRGSVVWLGWTMGWDGIREAIGGNPTLIEKGRIMVGRSGDPFFARHPRTGIGITKHGHVLLVTVDGRQRKSVGMTLRGFARLFRKQGARWAINLDGGGSTTMVVRGRVINRPSDRRERPVSSALVLLSDKSKKKRSKAKIAPPRGTWAEVAEDPASTGGLAATLGDEGVRLPDDLGRAADRLERVLDL